ncbi:hypothetical protein, partial [Methanobrevibacter sp.]|uniref:hypothetical protein n=1 Tax=Methanobrevibacter sp. TaxID=66852 RepID=UPI00388E36BE
NYKTNILKVTGNNVKIFNLTFINSKYSGFDIPIRGENDNNVIAAGITRTILKVSYDESPVCWSGNNGLIDNCIFANNTALNGGAIKWSGNNGVINNSIFIDNVARGVGGAIYIAGNNNKLVNTIILNSTSQLTGESIYLDHKSKTFTFTNCTTDNSIFLIDGNYLGIDVDKYLKYTYYSEIADKYINLIPIMYEAIMLGFAKLDDELVVYAQYMNETGDFTFSAIKSFNEVDIEYQKNYVFKNTTLNDAFESLINDNYKNTYVYTKSVSVTNTGTYEFICHSLVDDLFKSKDIGNIILSHDRFKYNPDVSFVLNVFYAPGSVFESNAQWVSYSGYSVVNIFGNGAKIKATSKDRDENKWIVTSPNQVYTINNLTVEGFNTAIDNREGYCVLNNVVFNNNRMDYIIERDWGAAILNTGYIICENCRFTNNYAKNGGAIFNQGFLSLNNCTFKGNTAYGCGDNVCVGDGGRVQFNGMNLTGDFGPVYFAESMSATESTILSALAPAIASIAGVVVAAFTFNPGIGIIAGFGVGTLVGAAFSGAIISQHYDVNFNRLETALTITIESALAGGFGGFESVCGHFASDVLKTAGISLTISLFGEAVLCGEIGAISGLIINAKES